MQPATDFFKEGFVGGPSHITVYAIVREAYPHFCSIACVPIQARCLAFFYVDKNSFLSKNLFYFYLCHPYLDAIKIRLGNAGASIRRQHRQDAERHDDDQRQGGE